MIGLVDSDAAVAFMKAVLQAAVDASGDRRGEVIAAILKAIDSQKPGTRHWWAQSGVARPLMDLQAEYNRMMSKESE